MHGRGLWLGIAFGLGLGCATMEPPLVFDVVDRASGDRAPLTRACEDLHALRCLTPWPSNAFTVADPASATGLRLSVSPASLNGRDDASSLALADGFSPVTPLLAVFEEPLDESTLASAVHLYVAQADAPDRGREIPLRVETLTESDGTTLVLADPMEVLAPGTDHVAVITDALRSESGAEVPTPRGSLVALGLAEPRTQAEADLAGYHAPTRALLEQAGHEPERVRLAWDFTTRSEENPRRVLRHMREAALQAVDAGEVGVEVDNVVTPSPPSDVAMIVFGRLTNVPSFLDEDGGFAPDAEGLPVAQPRGDAPFRVLVPAGTGDYRFLMYGHGTGGNEADDAFDADLAAEGLAKVNVRLYGWTDADVIATFASLSEAIEGSFGAAAALTQAIAHAAAIQRAMATALGDALSADTIDGAPNPAAGRRPDPSVPFWVGGSLGGTSGVVYAASDPEVRYAVVNVPGAAWSQWVWHSETLDLIHGLIATRYDDAIDLNIALTLGQTNLDMADGAAWASALEEAPTTFLVQQSMGDPILPNQGTEMVAITVEARHVGGVLEAIEGVEPAAGEVVEASAITQFLAPEGDAFAVHGFAARDTPAGAAAREQIVGFVRSALAGEAVIAPPPSCPADGCRFR